MTGRRILQQDESNAIGEGLHALVSELFPICRSLTGEGVRKTLSILQGYLPELTLHEVPSGTRCFDWTVPPEWNIRDAYLIGPNGEKVIDFADSNLHVVGYSVPVDREISLAELQNHLYSREDLPDAIPYVTSYYQERWGFCLTHRQRQALPEGTYRAVIDSDLKPGALTFGELVIPGETCREVLLSTYICHPSMANNELSGPCVTTFLGRWISGLERRRYTYRLVFLPETIGAITYLSRRIDHLKRNVIAGYQVTCVGDDRNYSYLPSRAGDTLSDRVAKHVLAHHAGEFVTHSFLERGSDERQYNAPGVDLPVASVMRTRYDSYPEYHTSLDDLSLVSPAGLAGGYKALRRCLEAIESEAWYKTTVLCEPQLGRRGLYSTLGREPATGAVRTRLDVLAYADGKNSVVDIAEILGQPVWNLIPYFDQLVEHGLLERTERQLKNG